jgi:hypothetical protein
MTTMNVKDAAGATVAVEKPLIPGQALMAASRPVVVASDQSAIPITVATIPSHAVTNAGTFAVQDSRFATEDAAASADPVGPVLIGVRRDTLSAAEVSADGDNIALKATSKGKLHVAAELYIADAAAATGAGASGATVLRTTLASDSPGIIATGSQASPSSSYLSTVAAGDLAHDAVDSGNPVKIGGMARSTEPSAVSASGDRVNAIFDLVGKLIVLPYANPENFVSGAITTAMTGTTTTSLIAAPAAGLRNYITQITVSNAHATVGTDVIIQDGSGGTTLYTIPAAAVYGGAVITFPTPLRQPTTATAIFVANVTTGASTKVSASGYKGV